MRKNYDTLRNLVKDTETRDKRHLTVNDRMDIEGARLQLVQGYHLATSSNDPEVLRAAVGLVMTGAFFIGMRCAPAVSQRKFFDKIVRGPGGKTTGKKNHQAAQIWKDWVRDEITRMKANGKWLKLPAAGIGRELRNRKKIPVTLPQGDRLDRFISKVLKGGAVSDKRKAIRLVHG
jgi:hypothetical protein